jgi:hypothetical protein
MNNPSTFEEYLEKNGKMYYSNVGVSMLPLLRQGKDLFAVEAKTAERCKAGDVILYRRPPHYYVLHRVIKVRKDDYVVLGDNCIRKEYGIRDEDILGVMCAYVRDGKEHSVRELRYRLYTFRILHTIPVRVFFRKIKLTVKRTIRQLRKH